MNRVQAPSTPEPDIEQAIMFGEIITQIGKTAPPAAAAYMIAEACYLALHHLGYGHLIAAEMNDCGTVIFLDHIRFTGGRN